MSEDSLSKDVSRRDFIKRSALAGVALASTAGIATRAAKGEEASSGGQGTSLTMAGYPFDRVKALVDGRVGIEGVEIEFVKAGIAKLNATAMGGPQSWAIQEIGLHPFMLAWANDEFRDYTLIPVFPLRTFRHKSIFVRADRGLTKPADLRGKRVGVAGYSQSSLTWIRGILQHEYGVAPDEMHWVISSSSSEGDVSKNEAALPEGIRIERGPAGKDESQLLVEGVVDAVFSAKEPQAFIDGDPIVERLFRDSRAVERAYFEKTRIFPIMHVVAIRKDVVENRPELPAAAFRAYSRAKSLMYQEMRDVGWAMLSIPWISQELEETRSLMGENFWPYGLTRDNRKTLDALFQYSHEQGFSKRKLEIEELFHPSTLELVDEA